MCSIFPVLCILLNFTLFFGAWFRHFLVDSYIPAFEVSEAWHYVSELEIFVTFREMKFNSASFTRVNIATNNECKYISFVCNPSVILEIKEKICQIRYYGSQKPVALGH